MAWTTPETWDVSKALSVARLNEQLRDNLGYLYDLWANSGWGFNYVRNGDFAAWQAGVSAAPDGWAAAGAGAAVAREDTHFQVGTHSARLTAAVTTETTLSQSLPAEWVKELGGTVALAAWVKTAVADRAKLRVVVTGGVTTDSAYHTGSDDWELLTVAAAVDPAATAISVKLVIVSGASMSAYVDGAILVVGEQPSAYVRSPNDIFPRLVWRKEAATSYRIGGGLIMQVGHSASAAGNCAVTFPAAFSVAPFVVLVTDDGGNARSVASITTAGFTAVRIGAETSGVYWMAIGIE